ncbi:hypothetical protein SLE2022_076670 [Rubroshorea leprosula]
MVSHLAENQQNNVDVTSGDQHQIIEAVAGHEVQNQNIQGVSPPSHNTTSISTHPMLTRTRIGTHTGHVKTIFPKNANTMITNDISSAGPDIKEPKNVQQALRAPHWLQAMKEELAALHQNNTWNLVPPPLETNIVGSRWVFKTKLNPDGTIERFKARLVAKGFSQVPGVDFDEMEKLSTSN